MVCSDSNDRLTVKVMTVFPIFFRYNCSYFCLSVKRSYNVSRTKKFPNRSCMLMEDLRKHCFIDRISKLEKRKIVFSLKRSYESMNVVNYYYIYRVHAVSFIGGVRWNEQIQFYWVVSCLVAKLRSYSMTFASIELLAFAWQIW